MTGCLVVHHVFRDVRATDLLVPGDPYSRRLSYVNGSWQPTTDQLPNWATSGVLLAGRLLLIGAKNGEFRFEERSFQLASK